MFLFSASCVFADFDIGPAIMAVYHFGIFFSHVPIWRCVGSAEGEMACIPTAGRLGWGASCIIVTAWLLSLPRNFMVCSMFHMEIFTHVLLNSR